MGLCENLGAKMKVIPKIRNKHKTVNYTDLKEGDAFVYGGDLYIKETIHDGQYGICLNDVNDFIENMCGTQVIPVNAEIRWSYKDKKGK